MDLREYLFKERISITDFATAIGYGRNYISQITLGNIIPGRKLAAQIEKQTEGKVKAISYLRKKNKKVKK